MRRVTVIVATLTGVALLLPTVSGARIQPGKRIMNVAIGDTQKDVEERHGFVDSIIRGQDALGVYFILPYERVEVRFEGGGNTVTSLKTESRLERTKRGTGVGSTKRKIKRTHRKARCTKGKFGSCTIGPRKPKAGQTVTKFTFRDGRVAVVEIQLVLAPR